jgi:predicted 3-demethylubiquinone-9 3-methyltransferase (glyoxalase superfamily)
MLFMPDTFFPSPFTCIWFQEEAAEAAAFYTQVLPDTRITHESGLSIELTCMGTRFLFLQGAQDLQSNRTQSLFLYAGSAEQAAKCVEALSTHGEIIMPFGTYPWASHYAWIVDRFGIQWQIDGDPIRSSQKIVTTVMFANEQKNRVSSMLAQYATIFPNFIELMRIPAGPDIDPAPDAVSFAQYKIGSTVFNTMASPLPVTGQFNQRFSQILICDTQESIDYYWDALGAGGNYGMCGWLEDRWGLAWQIIPAELRSWLRDASTSNRVMEALKRMQKIDINALRQSFE